MAVSRKNIQAKKISSPQPSGADAPPVRPRAVILTALQLEYSAVRNCLSDLQEQTHQQGTVYEIGVFHGQQSWDVALVEIGAGNTKTAAEAERAMQHFRPRVLLFVGVAGGLKDVRVGDVVVGTKVYGYESGKAESNFRPRPQVFASSYRLEQRARAEARKDDWLRRLSNPATNPVPRVLLGPIAAGEKVIASRASEISKFIQENYGDSLAIEMEGHGLLGAASINAQVDALVIRGVSDLLDRKIESDSSGTQELAAAHAAAFAFELLASIEPAAVLPMTPSATAVSEPLPLPPGQAQAQVKVVDKSGKGDYQTVGEAVQAAIPGEQIVIRSGLYEESIVLDKVLELFGDGARGSDIVVQCSKSACLSFRATLGRVSNITFRQIGITDRPCIDIGQGRLELEGCGVSSQESVGIAIHDGADPRIRHNNIHDNRAAGILVMSDASGTIEDNTIFHNGKAGLESASGGGPTARSNVIRDNGMAGIYVHDQGTGTFDDNDIFGNELGVSVSVSSRATILRNRIHDNVSVGIQIGGQAEGIAESNTIAGQVFGIRVSDESKCTVRKNTVRGSSRSGISVEGQSHTIIEGNRISGHSYWGVNLDSGSSAIIKKNHIHNCSASGIRGEEKSSAHIEANHIYRNQQCGVHAEEMDEAIIRGNKIIKNSGIGVWGQRNRLLTLENNDLRGNRSAKRLTDNKGTFDSGNLENEAST